jgi:hypothetical protein
MNFTLICHIYSALSRFHLYSPEALSSALHSAPFPKPQAPSCSCGDEDGEDEGDEDDH